MALSGRQKNHICLHKKLYNPNIGPSFKNTLLGEYIFNFQFPRRFSYSICPLVPGRLLILPLPLYIPRAGLNRFVETEIQMYSGSKIEKIGTIATCKAPDAFDESKLTK